MVDGMTLGIIAMVLGGFALGMGICNIIHTAYGEQYKFNMTEELNNETKILTACMTFNLDLDACDQIYGGIAK